MNDDLKRSRLTVFFRLLLAIPQFIWLYIWGLVTVLVVFVNWFATLFAGRSPKGLHEFTARYLRYVTHVNAYIHLLANPFPGFAGNPGYPIDLEIDPPQRQSRWKTGFRTILAIPALIFLYVLQLGLNVIGFLGWFVCLALGRMPEGMRNFGCFCLRFQSQAYAYLFLLTDRYPSVNVGLAD